jgi:hypothetical protein
MDQAQEDLGARGLDDLASEFTRAATAAEELSVRLDADRALYLEDARLWLEKGSLWLLQGEMRTARSIPSEFRLVAILPDAEVEVEACEILRGGWMSVTRTWAGGSLATTVYIENLEATAATAAANLSTSSSLL